MRPLRRRPLVVLLTMVVARALRGGSVAPRSDRAQVLGPEAQPQRPRARQHSELHHRDVPVEPDVVIVLPRVIADEGMEVADAAVLVASLRDAVDLGVLRVLERFVQFLEKRKIGELITRNCGDNHS